MSSQAKELAERLKAFNTEMIAFVEKCSDEEWHKVCSGEEWPVGIVARHVAKGHYGAFNLAKMIVAGEKLPDITKEAIDQGNAKHAEEHTDCTKKEVLDFLHQNGSTVADFLSGLEDSDLDRTGYLTITGEISAKQFIENVILNSSNEHLSSMKKAIG